MISGLKSIRRERASLERDRVLLTSMLEDAEIADAIDSVIEDSYFEGVSEDEIEQLIAKIPESDEEDEQVDRILASNEDLDVDAILNVTDNNAE